MDRRVASLTAVVVALAAVLAHGRSLWGGFVYDDHRFVERNPAIESLSDPWRFFADPSTASAGQGVEPDVWRPLRTLDFAADRALFGLDPFGWHLGNVALHAVNALLVWVLLLRVLRGAAAREAPGRGGTRGRTPAADVAAAVGAILFAVHPVAVEAVAWVSSRGDLLAWTLVLLALEVCSKPGARRTVLGAVLVGLACLAKESAVVAFALLPLRDAALAREERPPARETLLRTALFAVVTAGYLVARKAVLPGAADLPAFAQTEFPEGGRAAAARGFLASLVWYARGLLWPVGFPFDRNVHTDPVPDSWGDPAVVVGLGILATALLVGARALRRRDGPLAFAVFGSLVVLVPVSNVIVPLKAFAAERFLYPVLPCLAAGVAVVGWRLAARGGETRRLALAGAAVVAVVVLGFLASSRARAWADEASLWTAVAAEDPMNPRAHEGLGFEALRAGDFAKAERAFRTYREFQPFDGKVQAELAATFWGIYEELLRLSEGVEPGWNVADRQRFVLEQVLLACRAAVDAWTRQGLTRARGSEELVRSTLRLQRAAALEYGDYLEAKRANAMLAGLEEGRTGSQGYRQRRVVWILAARTVVADPRARPETRVERDRVRAELLRDAGIDPNLSNPQAARLLLPGFEALLAEEPRDSELRYESVKVWIESARDLAHEEMRRVLLRVRTELRTVLRDDPGHSEARRSLDGVEQMIGP